MVRPILRAGLAAVLVSTFFGTLVGCDLGVSTPESPLGFAVINLSQRDGRPVGARTIVGGASTAQCATIPQQYPFPDDVAIRIIDTNGRQRLVEGIPSVDPGVRRCLLLAVGPDRRQAGAVEPTDPGYVPDTVVAVPVTLNLQVTAPFDTVEVDVVL